MKGFAMSDILRLAWRMLVGIFLLMVLEMPCMAGTPQQLHTLEQIASKKTITLGYQDDAFPFSWQNGNAPAGYSIDICNSIVSALKTKLQLKNLKVEWVKTNSASQFVLIKNHMADIMCIPAFYSKNRHSISEFSLPFYFSSTRFVMRKNESNNNLAQLSGHSVLVKSGTIYVEQLQKVNVANDLDINIQLDTNNITAFNELKNGEYYALISSTVLLKGMIAQTANPEDYELSDIALSAPLPAGLLLPLHDKEFKAFVDGAISSLMTSNEFTALYNKWFQSPIPSKAINLNIPMSDNLKALTAAKKKISFDYEKYN
ncbi:Glutamate/aspartate import solute-binding protein [Citrobacter freundii]|uniref:Glutamate/aspartate import solute-binding protein n=3 Tax=Citrobacter freundii TaxID=546 RepID=A0AAD1TSW7_CITFR|nr:Glutamate/aspartate import solute-binding protein [Citrobacter freundii]CAH6570825.1 Glutamate/aspartate import solute-binding protein [Citrobacter freundii]SQA82055.1 glutamate and aspartate transporter subunit [Citrobacter freundii]